MQHSRSQVKSCEMPKERNIRIWFDIKQKNNYLQNYNRLSGLLGLSGLVIGPSGCCWLFSGCQGLLVVIAVIRVTGGYCGYQGLLAVIRGYWWLLRLPGVSGGYQGLMVVIRSKSKE